MKAFIHLTLFLFLTTPILSQDTLHDDMTGYSTIQGSANQEFTGPTYTGSIIEISDHFEIPTGEVWKLGNLSIQLEYFAGTAGCDVDTARIRLYTYDTAGGGQPGVMFHDEYDTVSGAALTTNPIKTAYLGDNDLVLGEGKYYVSFISVLNFDLCGQVFTFARSTVDDQKAKIIDHDNLFGLGHTSWTAVTNVLSSTNDDLFFMLTGTRCPEISASVSTSGPTFDADDMGPDYSYQWVDCDAGYAPISGETGSSFTATATGNYALIVSTDCETDTSACQAYTSPSGLNEEPEGQEITVSPNPASNVLFVGLTDGSKYQVLNTQGALVDRGILESGKIVIENLSPGIYQLVLEDGEGIYRAQFVKQ